MAAPLKTSLAPNLLLPAGYVIRFTALDPSTGNTVTGVRVTNATIRARDTSGGTGSELASGAFRLVPGPGA